jgi:hypothetical protein
MPAIHLDIGEVPVIVSANSSCLIRLFIDYFRYYNPRRDEFIRHTTNKLVTTPEFSGDGRFVPLVIELKMRRELPRQRLIPQGAELFSKTGVVRLCRERIEDQSAGLRERFYFDLGVAAFRVDPQSGHAIGLVSPESLEHPHILANTYALFALLLMLRSRGLYHLHAAATISPDGELWLICGAERSGKTTLTTALGIGGWRPIADDSLLIGFDGVSPRLSAFKKYFHIGDELLRRWREIEAVERRHRYSDRACVAGLEFFGTKRLANKSFRKIDRIVLPEITGARQSRIEPIPRSQAFLRLAEQSMFFQLWPEHTKRQWEALIGLGGEAVCHRFFSGTDIIEDPKRAAKYFEMADNF